MFKPRRQGLELWSSIGCQLYTASSRSYPHRFFLQSQQVLWIIWVGFLNTQRPVGEGRWSVSKGVGLPKGPAVVTGRHSGDPGVWTGKAVEGFSCELGNGYICSARLTLPPAGGDSVTAWSHCPFHPGYTRNLRSGFAEPCACGRYKMCSGIPLSRAAFRSLGTPPDHLLGVVSVPLSSCAVDRLSPIKMSLPEEPNAMIFLLYLHENQQMLAS